MQCSVLVTDNDLAPVEDPTSELYTWFFLAQHYDHLRQYTRALEYIDKCLQHTSTFIEAQAIKGQIYKVSARNADKK